jgi:hypothetical protein
MCATVLQLLREAYASEIRIAASGGCLSALLCRLLPSR